jgi:hypothetical protein
MRRPGAGASAAHTVRVRTGAGSLTPHEVTCGSGKPLGALEEGSSDPTCMRCRSRSLAFQACRGTATTRFGRRGTMWAGGPTVGAAGPLVRTQRWPRLASRLMPTSVPSGADGFVGQPPAGAGDLIGECRRPELFLILLPVQARNAPRRWTPRGPVIRVRLVVRTRSQDCDGANLDRPLLKGRHIRIRRHPRRGRIRRSPRLEPERTRSWAHCRILPCSHSRQADRSSNPRSSNCSLMGAASLAGNSLG